MPLTPDPKFFCYRCNHELVFEVKMGFRETCPHCASDLHVCKNCQLYDPGAHNSCRESTSDYVPDKEKANFCGYFKFVEGLREGNAQVDKAKAALEALFKKKK
jgi:hypothetical protein